MLIKIPTEQGYTKELDATLAYKDSTISIESYYDTDLINFVRSLDGAKWDKANRIWYIKNNEHNQYVLNKIQGKIDPQEVLETWTNWPVHLIKGFFEHQIDATKFAYKRRRCMLALEMGLGKTLVCIRLMELVAIREKVYRWWLIAPSGAQQEWQRQFKRWDAKLTPVAMSTYESLHHLLLDNFEDDLPDGVIFDESIKIKNPLAIRSQYAYQLCEKLRKKSEKTFIILLSGSPAPKDPSDWWHQIECIQPGFLREGSILKFKNRYAILEMQEGEFGSYFKIIGWKEDELKKLSKNLAPIVLVKKKKDCLDLPDKIYEQIECSKKSDLEIAKAIIKLSDSGIQALEQLREFSDGFQYQYTDGVRTTKWLGSPKIVIIEQLLDFYHTENGGTGHLIIYAAFHAIIDKLCELVQSKGWSWGRIDGRGLSYTNPVEGVSLLDAFDKIENMCIIANPACVHGLSFVKTECLCYYSNGFSVDARIQSLERRDRPGASNRGTRIVDIINLPIDKMIVDKLTAGINLQSITLEEIQRCLEN